MPTDQVVKVGPFTFFEYNANVRVFTVQREPLYLKFWGLDPSYLGSGKFCSFYRALFFNIL